MAFRYLCFCVLVALGVSFLYPYFGVLVGLVCFGLWFLYGQRHCALLGLCFLFSLGYGLWRQELSQTQLQAYEGSRVQVQGLVYRFPEFYPSYTKIYLQVSHIQNNELEQPESVLVRLPVDQPIHYGDILSLAGQLQEPRSFSGFDYESYLQRFGVFYLLQKPENIEVLASGQGNVVLQKASALRGWFVQKVKERVSYPYSVLGVGVLVGVKEVFPPSLDDMIRKSGLQHIIVVSGFNITIIVLVVALLFRRFGRVFQFGMCVGSILFFLALTGADPPVVRAGVMGIIAAYGVLEGKSADMPNVLLFAAMVLALWNPWLLMHDLGFQLSFMATAGIILFVSRAQKMLSFIRWEFLRDVLAVSLVAQISVFPLLSYTFADVPMGGILANIFVEPLVPLMMLFTFLTALVPFHLLALATTVVGSGIFWCARVFSLLPEVSIGENWSFVLLVLQIIFFSVFLLKNSYNEPEYEKTSTTA